MWPLKSSILFALTLSASIAAAQSAAPVSTPANGDNYYAAGNTIRITTSMPRDVIAAGREVEIAGRVSGDVLAAGWRVSLTGEAGDDVRIGAGEVALNAPVGGDVTIAGGDVTIGPMTHVAGRSWITGRTVKLEGTFDRETHIVAETVLIAGEIRQPLEVIADKLEIESSARVLGPMTYKGPSEAHVAQGAVVNGPVTYDRIPEAETRRARAVPTASTVLFTLHLFFAGLLVTFFLPRFESSIIETLRGAPGKSLLAGIILVVAIPVSAVLLVITVLGMPIGFALAAIFAIALFAAVLATAFFLGDAEARLLGVGPIRTRAQHALLLLAGVVTLALLRAVLGGVVVFLSVLFGLGAMAMWLYRAHGAHAPTLA